MMPTADPNCPRCHGTGKDPIQSYFSIGDPVLGACVACFGELITAVQRADAAKIRAEVPRGYCPCADLIDPDKEPR